jgi:hypothetical protein
MELQLGMNGFLVNGVFVRRVPFLRMKIESTDLSQNAARNAMPSPQWRPEGGLAAPRLRKRLACPIAEPMAVIIALEQFFASKPSLSTERASCTGHKSASH